MGAARELLRIVAHARRVRRDGPRRYDGTPEAVCRQVVERCWDAEEKFFRTSPNNYPIFYCRDFGMTADALLALGEKERVRSTLAYALGNFARDGRVTQQISPDGKPFNFPRCEHPDALAFLLHALIALNDERLIAQHKGFLSREVRRYADAVVDPQTGLVRRGVRFAGMRDYAVRDSSCYDNAMIAAVSKYAAALHLPNPLQEHDYGQLLLTTFWAGTHFRDDRRNEAMTGDANVVPFWFRVLDEKDERRLFPLVRDAIIAAGLDAPYPLRYETGRGTTRMLWLDAFTGGWERDTAWPFLGNLWTQVALRHDKRLARRYVDTFTRLIENERNYPEVIAPDGTPHASFFFHADDSMLWAANFIALRRSLK